MSTPQALPPKAVIRALQGLLLGTSCSLAVLIEDRRRRINAVKAAIDNGKKLKAFPLYRDGGSQRALARALATCEIDPREALKSGLIIDPSVIDEITSKAESEYTHIPTNQDDTPSLTSVRPGTRWSLFSHGVFMHPRACPLRLADITSRAFGTTALEEDVIGQWLKSLSKASDMLNSPLEPVLQKGWTLAMQCLSRQKPWFFVKTSLIRDIIQVSRELAEGGRTSDALILLRRAGITPSTVPSTQAHFVERVIMDCMPSTTMTRAVEYYQLLFTARPAEDLVDEVLSAGCNLVRKAVANRQHNLARELASIPVAWSTGSWKLREAYCIALVENGSNSEAVNQFLSHYPGQSQVRPSGELVDSIVDAVYNIGGRRSDEVLELLFTYNDFHLSSKCVSRLLSSHWMHFKDVTRTRWCFDTLLASAHLNTRAKLVAYHVLMRIYFSLCQVSDGHALYREMVSRLPRAKNDWDTVQVMVLEEARQGAWGRVWEQFTRMARTAQGDDNLRRKLARMFFPVLEEYGKTHTFGEIQEFLRDSTEQLDIPLSKYAVTWMAKKYAQRHDTKGLLGWLQYCGDCKVSLEPSFLTAVVSSCYRHYDLSFSELRRLVRRLKKLNPGFTAEIQRRILRDAACREALRGNAKGTLKKSYGQFEPGDERAALRAMKGAMLRGKPEMALRVYEEMRYLPGVDRGGSCLRAAIQALVLRDNGDSEEALRLLREAELGGHNIVPSLATLLMAHLDQLPPTADIAREFVDITDRLEKDKELKIPGLAFSRAALKLMKHGRQEEAIDFCQAAARQDAMANVAETKHHFHILLECFALTGNVAGLEGLMRYLETAPYRTEVLCLKRLREVKNMLVIRSHPHHIDRERCIQLINEGIYLVQSVRAQVVRDWPQIEKAALRIISEAAEKASMEEPMLRASGGDLVAHSQAARAKDAMDYGMPADNSTLAVFDADEEGRTASEDTVPMKQNGAMESAEDIHGSARVTTVRTKMSLFPRESVPLVSYGGYERPAVMKGSK